MDRLKEPFPSSERLLTNTNEVTGRAVRGGVLMERRISHVHWFMACLLAIAGLLTLAFPAAADGIIIPHPPPGRPPIPWRDIPLSIKYHHVDVTIENQVATTRVDQVFV